MSNEQQTAQYFASLAQEARELQYSPLDWARFQKWKLDVEIALDRTFGRSDDHYAYFKNLTYFSGSVLTVLENATNWEPGLQRAAIVLDSIVGEISQFGFPPGRGSEARIHAIDEASIAAILRICERFHFVARQLSRRHKNKAPFVITDEYDVQDLFHALLQLYFADIRQEEWAPSYAGGCSRVDFLIKSQSIVVELKKTRLGLSQKAIGEQLIIDIARYRAHPDCETLICFVYDAAEIIANPRGLENDLNTQQQSDLKVIVKIAP